MFIDGNHIKSRASETLDDVRMREQAADAQGYCVFFSGVRNGILDDQLFGRIAWVGTDV